MPMKRRPIDDVIAELERRGDPLSLEAADRLGFYFRAADRHREQIRIERECYQSLWRDTGWKQ